MRIPLTPHGAPELALFTLLFGAGAAAAVLAAPGPGGMALAVLPLLSLGFVVSFFRDPERRIPGDEATVVAPADGRVTDILRVERAPFIDGPAIRVGIFLSVFDVHVNRAPVAGRVAWRHHRPGAYLDARDPACADQNEACDLGLAVDDGEGGTFPVLVRQIAGLIARRIVCPVQDGQALSRGQRYGMIKFGSRTEVWLPAARVESLAVKVGDRVKGGFHPVARLKVAASAPATGRAG